MVFSPRVDRASGLLPSPCLLARKLLQFLVFSPQVERAPARVPSPFDRKLLLLGHYDLLC